MAWPDLHTNIMPEALASTLQVILELLWNKAVNQAHESRAHFDSIHEVRHGFWE